jgi:citrate synthase
MPEHASLTFRDKTYELPVIEGSEHELGADIGKLRGESGLITLDDGYGNTGSCRSEITFIDGETGILRYRGYPIEQLADKSNFIETAWLLIFGELPTNDKLEFFRKEVRDNHFINEALMHHFKGFPPNAHPMAILSAMINAMGCYQPVLMQPEDMDYFEEAAARLISKIRTIAAVSYRNSHGLPIEYPRGDLPYAANFLHMMFSMPHAPYEPDDDVVKALDQVFILHADHEQNCSTSTVRMVGSSRANLYASISSGVCALWGPLHGGANQAVIKMLTEINASGEACESYMERVKSDPSVRLMGFGHRVYKNFDPRATILKNACDKVLKALGVDDPLLDIARRLEDVALKDSYFVERKL